ncbi:aminotransferase class I/II-fold pyridoxal phosphate-dependent enzyme [Ruminococcaceae bacterium OttesenSCG-928-D13]|nr:aminotransferase class I/II-fold pyridoxal phosphate-dependent enzyme [Ruminococcaceae bacterium OttesenSCG-928-D13]
MNELHGGDITGYRLRYGREPLDFSASLNPLGMPEGVKQAAVSAVADAAPYPDPHARALTAALAAKLAVKPEHIILGNGSADLIYRWARAAKPQRALLTAPAFAEYERALRAAGCAVSFHSLNKEQSFDLDESVLAEITPGVDALFLCQPNNPTGRLIAPELLNSILDACRRAGTRLFLDECFVPFVAGAKTVSRTPRLAEYPELFILGSFTKLYAMAGLRLGFGLSADTALLGEIALAGQPWGVSTVAQVAGVAALAEDDYLCRSLVVIETEKAWLTQALAGLGICVIGGAANYLFFASKHPALGDALARAGIMIRECAGFRGLETGHYRIAVRTRAENAQLIEAMREILFNQTDQ